MSRRVTVLCCIGLVAAAIYPVFRDQVASKAPVARTAESVARNNPDMLLAYFDAGSDDLLVVSGRPAELVQFREAYGRGLRVSDAESYGSIRHLTQENAHARNNASCGKMLFRVNFCHPVNGVAYQRAIQHAMQETGCRFVSGKKSHAVSPH